MSDRADDWLTQARRDLDQAADSRAAERHEWACFASHQAAVKALKALHLHLGQEAWGHVVAKLLTELTIDVPQELIEKGRVLDTFYIPARYPNSHAEGAPFEHYGPLQSAARLLRKTADPRGRPSSTTGRSRVRRRSPMPVRSLGSPVIRWPARAEVLAALKGWARRLPGRHPLVVRVGYFGSFARGDWGVGSDVDIVVLVASSDEAFPRRGAAIDATPLPVPADVLVYTRSEWENLERRGRGPAREDVVWVEG